MKLVFSHGEETLKSQKDIYFSTNEDGIYAIKIEARAKSEKQLNGTDDEDLRIEIDKRKFPHLSNPSRLFDSPASFSGGSLKNLRKLVFFIIHLNKAKHTISLIPDISADLKKIEIFELSPESGTAELAIDYVAEDGDRRPWITFVLVDIGYKSFSVDLKLKRRLMDSDDVKVIVDGDIKRNTRDSFRKLWYFIASILTGEDQNEEFIVNLLPSLHYIEFWADRMPTMDTIKFHNLITNTGKTIEEQIRNKAQEYGLDANLMLAVARKESNLDKNAVSPVGAKGIFQLMDITIEQIANLGFEVKDPFDADQNITGGLIYFKWLYDIYTGDEEQLEKTLTAWNWGLNNFSKDRPLDYKSLPEETRNFIKDILSKIQ